MYKQLMIACLAGVSMGCSSPSDNATENKPELVIQDQLDVLDKAQNVEKMLLDTHQRRDAAMRQQE